MKKVIIAIFAIILISTFAMAAPVPTGFNLRVVQMNSSWAPVVGGAYGQVLAWKTVIPSSLPNMQFIGIKLKPSTSYTLIYYGYETHNDEWPYATCIATATTNTKGTVSGRGTFAYSPFLTDLKSEKFWVIKTSDVNCTTHQMNAWNPNEYLFETRLI